MQSVVERPTAGTIPHQLLGAPEGYGFPEMGQLAATIESLAKNKTSSSELTEAIAQLSSLSLRAERGLSKNRSDLK